jgi:tetratricopeptide (TPR) repeat protein
MHNKVVAVALILVPMSFFAWPMTAQNSETSKDAKACYERANELIKKSQFVKAIAESTKAIEINSNYQEAYVVRGVAYACVGENDRAIADLSEAIRLKPKDPDGYRNRSIAYSKKGEKEKALADLAEARRLEGK